MFKCSSILLQNIRLNGLTLCAFINIHCNLPGYHILLYSLSLILIENPTIWKLNVSKYILKKYLFFFSGKQVKRLWTEGEKAAVLQYFGCHIAQGKLPGKKEVDECKKSNFVLDRRTWKNVKDYVRNRIATNKTKKLF